MVEEKNREILKMRNIHKAFPGVKAISDVDFTLREGEIHALMGENGAGKSTLIKLMTGVESFDAGEMWIEGKGHPIVNRSPQEARKNGISTVYQEINLCPNLSVAENIFMGREPRKLLFIDWKAMNKRAAEILANFDIDIDVTRPLDNYPLAVQQIIAIAGAVDMASKVLVLDEPTSSLDDWEVEKLFSVMRKLKERGTAIIFITHFLEQVYEICDRITVLRNGGLVGEYQVDKLSRVQLVAKMMGKEFDDLAEIKKATRETEKNDPEEARVRAEGLGLTGSVKPFQLLIKKGEVVGLAGLLGSGRSEMARVIYGADKADSGELWVHGKKCSIRKPIDAMMVGMAFCPENRKEEGIIPDLSVRENMILALQAKRGMFRLLGKKEQEELADKFIGLLNIKTSGQEIPVSQLSGGNQQKVILGRWLITQPDFLILDEPTRGIDVGTKTEIQKLIIDFARKGMSVMFISSEMEEMLRTVNRMIILRDGKKVGELEEEEMSQESIMRLIAGGEANAG